MAIQINCDFLSNVVTVFVNKNWKIFDCLNCFRGCREYYFIFSVYNQCSKEEEIFVRFLRMKS